MIKQLTRFKNWLIGVNSQLPIWIEQLDEFRADLKKMAREEEELEE